MLGTNTSNLRLTDKLYTLNDLQIQLDRFNPGRWISFPYFLDPKNIIYKKISLGTDRK